MPWCHFTLGRLVALLVVLSAKMNRLQHNAVDATAQLYMKSQEAIVALKVELQKSRTEVTRVTNDA